MQQSIRHIIWDYKSKKQEMLGNIAQLAERMTVNHVAEGASPSVPAQVRKQQNYWENMCHWFESNHF